MREKTLGAPKARLEIQVWHAQHCILGGETDSGLKQNQRQTNTDRSIFIIVIPLPYYELKT